MDCGPAPSRNLTFRRLYVVPAAGPSTEANIAKRAKTATGAFSGLCSHPTAQIRADWGATVCANRFVAIKYPTEDEAKLARDHAATRCPNFTDGRPIDWQVLELPPTLDSLPRRDEEAG